MIKNDFFSLLFRFVFILWPLWITLTMMKLSTERTVRRIKCIACNSFMFGQSDTWPQAKELKELNKKRNEEVEEKGIFSLSLPCRCFVFFLLNDIRILWLFLVDLATISSLLHAIYRLSAHFKETFLSFFSFLYFFRIFFHVM